MLDLGKVPLLSGRALELMTRAASRLGTLGGWLKLAYPSPLLLDILTVTGVADQVALYDAPQRGQGGTPERTAETRRHPGRTRHCHGQPGRGSGALAGADRQAHGLHHGREKWLSESALFQALAEQLDLPFVSLRAGLYDPVAVSLLERDVAKRLNVIPLFVVENTLTIATGEPQAVHSIDEIRARTGCRIRVAMAPPADINRVRDDAYGGTMPDFIHSEANDLELVENQIPDDYTRSTRWPAPAR